MKTVLKNILCGIIIGMVAVSCGNTGKPGDASKGENTIGKQEKAGDIAGSGNARNDKKGYDSAAAGIDTIMKAYTRAVANETPHFDTEKKRNISFKEYCDDNNITAAEIRFTVLDLDGNGIPELVLEHNPGVLRVLRFENGVIYGFSFGFRGMNNLKKDGSFSWSDSAFNSGTGRRTFSGPNTDSVNLAEESTGQDGATVYYIDNAKVTEQKYTAFRELQQEKEDAEWHLLTGENINNFTTPAQGQDDFLAIVDTLLKENNLSKADMSAQDFNAAGMFFYEKKLWYEAEIMFFRATELNHGHVLAYYNLACVVSITFTDTAARHHTALYEDETTPFFYLYKSVSLDPGCGARARKDPDLDNIRTYDKELFDAITLPENQRTTYTHKVIYEGSSSFEGNINVAFADSKDRDTTYWFRADAKLESLKLYTIPGDAITPYAVDNEEMIGKTFEVICVYEPEYSDYRGGFHLFKSRKILSIDPVAKTG